MSTNNQKGLSQKQKEDLKKYTVFGLMFIAFAGIMYFLFAPKTEDTLKEKEHQGMNVSIPQAAQTTLWNDKKSAYEQQLMEQGYKKKRQTMADLSDFFAEDSIRSTPQKEVSSRVTTQRNPIRSSVTAYKDIHHTLDHFYTQDNTETKALEEEVAELKKQLAIKEDNESDVNKQLELMEKSYQIASKYLPSTASNTRDNLPLNSSHQRQTIQKANTNQRKHKLKVKTVRQYRPSVVSSLQGSFSGNPFTTAVGYQKQQTKNTIKACIHRTIVIRQGESLPIRLLEDITVENTLIPAQTVLTAMPKIQGNRMLLQVISVQHQGTLFPVNLSAYDLDGQEGLFVPGTLEQNAIKEVLASVGNSSRSANTFSMNSSASDQLIADMGKGVIQGTSNYLSKKIQDIKIKIKAGHSLLLYSSEK